MSGQAWKYSDQLDDMDLKMMKRDFFTYKIGMDYYGFSIRPLMRIAREAGAFYKIGKIVLINRECFDAYLRIVVNRAGMVTSYFVDLETLIPVPGFIQLSDPDAVIHADTVDYKIENHNGNWRSVDYLIFDGKQYFLMEN